MSERVYSIPEVELRPWHRWFAWRPVQLNGGGSAWLRYVERRDYWFVVFQSEYRALMAKEGK